MIHINKTLLVSFKNVTRLINVLIYQYLLRRIRKNLALQGCGLDEDLAAEGRVLVCESMFKAEEWVSVS
jgi:hypothetical protein